MNTENELPIIGIIGCGPRGLSALESLFIEFSKSAVMIRAVVFEASEYPGAGPVYHLDQPDSNWLNVSERAVGIPSRPEAIFKDFSIPAFPDFQHWSGYADKNEDTSTMDSFPLRSKLGKYLNERYQSIADILIGHGLMTFVHGEVNHVDVLDSSVSINLVGGDCYQVREAVLCIGHQPIALDEQMTEWKNRVLQLDRAELFTQPYPVSRILDSFTFADNRNIAVRGFGLAMIDVVRSMSEGLGGKFQMVDDATRKMKYIPNGKEPNSIIPFSLNGLPMAPKPLNKKIDSQYIPNEDELLAYEKAVRQSLNSKETLKSTDFLIQAISPLIADRFMALGASARQHNLSKEVIQEIVESWLTDENYAHGLIVSKEMNVEDIMGNFVHMATGSGTISLDFCIGHLWRHCQPTMYRLLSFASLSDELIASIVALDERLKRYSYGPPVDSLQQLLALVEAGKVNLDHVNNPAIELGEDGWQFRSGDKTQIVEIMVNSVLDAPQILKVVSPLPKGLINSSVIEPLHDQLGIRTGKNAMVESDTMQVDVPLALLGRLAKGTLIGVDAIAECFGRRSEFWAKGVIERLENIKR